MKVSDPSHFTLDRPTPALADKELEALRVSTWFFHVANRAIGREVSDFREVLWEQKALDSEHATPKLSAALQKWLNKPEQSNRLSFASLDFATNLRYVNYQSGKTSPADSTLALFEQLLPGSRVEYDYGPQGEPLWGVLAGKITICDAYIEDQLPPEPGSIEVDFSERVQRVFDSLIAPARRLKLAEVPGFGNVQQTAHPVWLSHIDATMRATYADDDDPELLETNTIDDQIVLAIALWQIALSRKEGPILRLEWLLMGLCYGVIAYHFNEEIQSYVLKLLSERGTVMDADAKRRGANILEFEKRWTTEIDVTSKAAELKRMQDQAK